MDDYLQPTIEYYDQVARRGANDTRPMLTELHDFVSLVPHGARVLDTGCAQGRQSQYLSNHGLDVDAIDLSGQMIELAKQQFPGPMYQVMDVRSLQFADDTFDGVWCNATLLHLDLQDIECTLGELHRVLKARGTMIVSLMEGSGSRTQSESNNMSRHFTDIDTDSLRTLLNQAGFEVVKVYISNERERWGGAGRDLNWLYAIARAK